MTGSFYEDMHQTLESDPAIRRIARNPVVGAELLLLFRMILADGVINKSELEMFRRICRSHFAIDDRSFHDVVRYLNFFCLEKTDAEAFGVFQSLDEERKRQLVEHMMEIAGADRDMHPNERSLLVRALRSLGYQGDVAEW